MDAPPEENGQAAQALDRLTRLQALTASLSEAVTSEQVADVILAHCRDVLGACAGVIYRLSDDAELVIVRTLGYADEAKAPWQRLPAQARMPIPDALRDGEPVLLASLAERNARYPQTALIPTIQREGAVAAIPMAVRGRPVGAIGLRFPSSRTFSGQDRAVLLTVAGLCAQALDRARLYDAERAARERFRLLTELVPQLVWSSLPGGHIDYCNPGWLSYTGLTQEQVQGDGWTTALHPDDHAATMSAWQRAVATGDVYQVEQRLRGRDGQYRWFLTRARLLRDSAGGVAKWYGTCTDIEAQKQAEQAVRDSEARFRQLVESVPQMVWVNLADGTLEYLNRPCLDYFGLSAADMYGWDWRQAIHPDDLSHTLAASDRAMRTGGTLYVEYRLRKHDGQFRWHICHASPLRDGAGRIVKWFGTAIDIHDRKDAGEQLLRARRESAELLALLDTLLSNAPVGFAFVGRDLRYVRVNRALAAMNGLPPEGHIGRTLQEVVPELWPLLRPIYESILAGGEAVTNVEVSGPTLATAGEARSWLVSYIPVRTGGEVIGVGIIVNDVTDGKRLEEQFRQAQKMEGIGRLAGGIAHDFNNLLTVINGFSGLLLADAADEDPGRPMLEDIQRAGQRAATLTRQLLAFGRKQILQPRVLDLNALVADLRTMLAPMIGEDVELVTALAPSLSRIRADASQVEQVVLNLAVNARDAMPGGGRLTIKTGNVRPGESGAVGLAEGRSGPYVLLSVSDTGTGMVKETQRHLFEPFFTTKGPGKGTGLGLATVYGIVKQSAGHIRVSSELGKGSTFEVYFPALLAPEEAGNAGPELAGVPGGREVVLVVEDEEGVRRLAEQMLAQLGYQALSAASGPEALAVAARHQAPIDLLLTDVVMPGMGGPAVAEALRPRHAGMRVLYMSGYADDAVLRHGILAQETALLQKPFSMAALAEKVRKVLDAPA